MNNNTQTALRDTYNRVADKFPGFTISRQVLRKEALLVNNKSNYEFTLRQGNSSTDGPLENLLNDSDAFVLLAVRLGIKKQDTTTTPNQYGNFPLFTYPDPQYFVGAPAGKPKEFQALACLYNGKLSFRTGSLERIRPMDTTDLQYIPASQVIKQATPAVNDTLPQFGGIGIESQGWIEMQPTILIDGQQNNTFRLDLGLGDYTAIDGLYTSAGAATNTAKNVVVLQTLGLVIHNGSEAAKSFASNWKL